MRTWFLVSGSVAFTLGSIALLDYVAALVAEWVQEWRHR